MSKFTTAVVAVALLVAQAGVGAHAHEDHGNFSAGEPGNPNKPARAIKVAMVEQGKKMLFEPARIEVRRGEQIRFVLSNDGIFNH